MADKRAMSPPKAVEHNHERELDDEPHACEIAITFPTNEQAEQAQQVLQVDPEPSDRVTKAFRLEEEMRDDDLKVVSMIVRFESKELKMLRVAVSSFYSYVEVVLRTMQEFDTTMTTGIDVDDSS